MKVSSRLIAGLDLGSTGVRVALAQQRDGLLQVRAMARAAMPRDAVKRGVVDDPAAATPSVRSALERAESAAGDRAEEIVAAIGGDDVRTFLATRRVERLGEGGLGEGELRRATGEAERDGARAALELLGDEPALRRTPLQLLEARPIGAALDGRPLGPARGQRGRTLEIDLLVTTLPVVQTSNVEAAFAGVRRPTRLVAAPVALGALLGRNGSGEVLLVDVGAQLTGVAVVRGGTVVGARCLSIGAAAFARRIAAALGIALPAAEALLERDEVDAAEAPVAEDARTWARCVALVARTIVADASLPPRALLAGRGSRLRTLTPALESCLEEAQPGLGARVEALRPALLPLLRADAPVDPGDLMAIAAAAYGQ